MVECLVLLLSQKYFELLKYLSRCPAWYIDRCPGSIGAHLVYGYQAIRQAAQAAGRGTCILFSCIAKLTAVCINGKGLCSSGCSENVPPEEGGGWVLMFECTRS